MLAEKKKLQNILVRTPEGAIYTVDEVSGLLGIPRPTLYRYLREYSIPHLRKEGRISIPEDSFDRIREARDLHKEGLGTGYVRRQLREDSGGLDRKLDSLHQTLERLRGDIRERPADEVASSPTLRTILARQSLLMSAMFNLTEMVEDSMLAGRKPRKRFSANLGTGYALPEEQARDRLVIPASQPSTTPAVTAAVQGSVGRQLAVRSTDFGALGRRRRRGVLAILATLLLVACLAWAAWALIGAGNDESSVPRVTETADEPPGGPKAIAETPQMEGGQARKTTGAGVATGGSRPEAAIEVPDVTGRSLEGAVRIISDAGFEVAAIKTGASQGNAATAIRTKPRAGASVRPGAPVILTMGGGPVGASQNASASASAGYPN
jgi:excisionase family DNA binding protein